MSAPLADQAFEIEIFLDAHKRQAAIDLASSGIDILSLRQLLEFADADQWRRLLDNKLEYVPHGGSPQLIDAIASEFGSPLGPGAILPTTGAQEAIHIALHALLGRGTNAVVVVPNYDSVVRIAATLCNVKCVALDPSTFSLSLEQLFDAVDEGTTLIALNFPNNPTGHVPPRASLDSIVEHCRALGIWLLCDEVYRGTELEPASTLPSVAEIYERGVAIDSVSKRHGVPGARIGWIACRDADFMRRCRTLRSYLSVCNSTVGEIAAEIAIRAGRFATESLRMRAMTNRERLSGFAREHPETLEISLQAGALFGFPQLKTWMADAFCQRLLRSTGVLVLPGSLFDDRACTFQRHIRINLVRENADLGLSRLISYVEQEFV